MTATGPARRQEIATFHNIRQQAEEYLWYLVVQREAIGLYRNEGLERHCPLPPRIRDESRPKGTQLRSSSPNRRDALHGALPHIHPRRHLDRAPVANRSTPHPATNRVEAQYAGEWRDPAGEPEAPGNASGTGPDPASQQPDPDGRFAVTRTPGVDQTARCSVNPIWSRLRESGVETTGGVRPAGEKGVASWRPRAVAVPLGAVWSAFDGIG